MKAKSLMNYAKKNGILLKVEVSDKDGKRVLRMSVDKFREYVRKHCFFYDAEKVSETKDEFANTITLSNGTEFRITIN